MELVDGNVNTHNLKSNIKGKVSIIVIFRHVAKQQIPVLSLRKVNAQLDAFVIFQLPFSANREFDHNVLELF